MDQPSDKTEENSIDALTSEGSGSVEKSENRVWHWILLALLIGGIGGWLIGRQSGLGEEKTTASVAAASQIVVTDTALPTVVSAASEINSIALGPTPASIQPETERTLGDPNAPVTIVEFSDYQCPFCRRHVQQTLPLLKENYIDTGRVYYVFKDFPIASLHPFAYRQHEAALCVIDEAGTEGYWQAHDLFFANTESFAVDGLETLDAIILTEFEQAGLPDISECLRSDKYAEAVQADLNEGRSLGVNGTPAFFINGFPISA